MEEGDVGLDVQMGLHLLRGLEAVQSIHTGPVGPAVENIPNHFELLDEEERGQELEHSSVAVQVGIPGREEGEVVERASEVEVAPAAAEVELTELIHDDLAVYFASGGFEDPFDHNEPSL